MTDVSQGDAHRLATQLAGAEGRASRRLRTIHHLRGQLDECQQALLAQAAIGADLARAAFAELLPPGVTIEQLVALWNFVHAEPRNDDSDMIRFDHLRSVKP